MPIEPQQPMLAGSDVTRLRDVYGSFRAAGFPDGWDVDDYKDLNFGMMMNLTRLTGIPPCASSCLDVGCGTGDFYQVWRANGGKEYTGIDVLPMQVVDANMAHPHSPKLFRHGEFLASDFEDQSDYVFASGVLSIKALSMERTDYLLAMLKKMISLGRVGVYANFFHDPSDWMSSSLTHWGFTQREVEVVLKSIEQETNMQLHRTYEFTPTPSKNQQAHVYIWK